jgi:hypothetical protein
MSFVLHTDENIEGVYAKFGYDVYEERRDEKD